MLLREPNQKEKATAVQILLELLCPDTLHTVHVLTRGYSIRDSYVQHWKVMRADSPLARSLPNGIKLSTRPSPLAIPAAHRQPWDACRQHSLTISAIPFIVGKHRALIAALTIVPLGYKRMQAYACQLTTFNCPFLNFVL